MFATASTAHNKLVWRATVARPARVHCTAIRAGMMWQLAPSPQKSKDQANAQLPGLNAVDLTEAIGRKRFCTVGTELDHSMDSDEVIHCQDSGVHVVFEAVGKAGPLDSPSSTLYITDISSGAAIEVDGAGVPKNTAVKLHPGSVIKFSDNSVYEVLRNYTNHA